MMKCWANLKGRFQGSEQQQHVQQQQQFEQQLHSIYHLPDFDQTLNVGF